MFEKMDCISPLNHCKCAELSWRPTEDMLRVLQVSDWIVGHDSASYVHWRLIEIASSPNTSQRTDKWQLGPFSSPPCLVHDEFQIYRCNPFKSSLFLHVKRQDPDTIFTILVWSSVVFYNFLSQYSFSLSLSLYSMSTYKHHICHICHRRSAGDSPNPSRCRWFHHCSERCGRSGGRWSASRGVIQKEWNQTCATWASIGIGIFI